MSASHEILQSDRHPFSYRVTGTYSEQEAMLLSSAIDKFYDVVGSRLGGMLISSDMCVKLERMSGNNFSLPYQICLTPNGLTEWTIVHEMGHALDASYGWNLSRRMRKELGSGFPIKVVHKAFPRWKWFWYRVGSPPPPCGVDDKFNSLEDFAETVTAFIFPELAKQKAEARGYAYEKYGYQHFHETPRGRFFQRLLDE